jgi:predicted amidophosphoribosyltransferase
MMLPIHDLSPYVGLNNLLELVVPPILEHYAAHVTPLGCDCAKCRRDIASFVLCALPPLYYGSLTEEALDAPKIQWRTVSADKIDQAIRRAIAIVGERPHHHRGAQAPGTIETVTPAEVARRIVDMLLQRPLFEQLYGVPIPICIPCNEVGRRAESRFCDRCGGPLVEGLPSVSLRGD